VNKLKRRKERSIKDKTRNPTSRIIHTKIKKKKGREKHKTCSSPDKKSLKRTRKQRNKKHSIDQSRKQQLLREMKQTRLAWNVILSHLTSVKTKSQEKDGKKKEEEVLCSMVGWLIKKRSRGEIRWRWLFCCKRPPS